MNKREIISFFKDKVSYKIMVIIKNSLVDDKDYYIEENDGFRIFTEIEEEERGSNIDIKCNKNSIVITEKVYSPNFEIRYGFCTEVALEIFTRCKSYIYDDKGKLIYKFDYSDDNKYYRGDRIPLRYDRESITKMFRDTNPVFNNGYLVKLPACMYQPFSNVWQRYGSTHVVKEFGRNPIEGEYSEIKVTFDEYSHSDVPLLHESYGQFYVRGKQMKYNDEEEIVEEIERIYQESIIEEGFDYDYFFETFDNNMFEKRRRI